MRCAFILLLCVALVVREPRFGAQSRLVLMPVSVKDRSGQPIDGLEAADFAVLDEGRPRKFSLHFNVTRHPTAEWVVQQLREAFPEAGPYRYVILDRDSKFDADVITFLKATGLKPKRTSLQSPWQNGTAVRWVGSCRREILDPVIAPDERHLLQLVRDCRGRIYPTPTWSFYIFLRFFGW